MKRCVSLLLMIAMMLPLFTAFSALGAFAAEAVYDKPDLSDSGLGFEGMNDGSLHYAKESYRAKKRFARMPHTFQAWVYLPEGFNTSGAVISNYAAKNDTWGSFIYVAVSSDRSPTIHYYDDIVVDHELKFTKSKIPTETWTLMTIVWDGDTGYVYCYLNGTLSETKCFLPDFQQNAIEMEFGLGGDRREFNTAYFRGRLQDVSVYATARTAEQVQADYEKGVNVADTELICHYDLSSADKGQNVADASGNGYTMWYSKTWLTETEMEEIRAGYQFTPAYSFAVIGDTQKTTFLEGVTKKITTPTAENSVSYRMYKWLVDNRAAKNLQVVIGVGDITDANLDPEWAMIKQAIEQMSAASLPYTLVRGNHDTYTATREGYKGRGEAGFDQYFGPGTPYYEQIEKMGGFYDTNSSKNTYLRLEANGSKWLIICMDHHAGDAALNWMGGLCETYSDHKVIISTHIYQNAEGDPISYGGLSDSPNNGDDKWNKLAAKYPNVEMVLSGHIGSDRIVTTQVKGDHGNTVTQMMIDPQGLDERLKGAGFIAMFYFNADGTEFYTEMYSVEKNAYLMNENQFYVDLEAEGYEQEATRLDMTRGVKPSGKGTESDPYLISKPEHLAWMAYQVDANDHMVWFDNTYFKQVCDIDLQGRVLQSIGGYFKYATGDSSALNAKAFGGHYDGGGFVIKNGTITATQPDIYFNKRKQFGLFGCIYGATIENVTVADMVIVGRGPTGAIVGKAMAPWDGSGQVGFNKIIGCRVGEDVEIRTWHPVGVSGKETTDYKEYDNGYRAGVVGGVCGIAYATLIQGCSAANTIRVSGIFGMVGGIAGTAGYNTVIDHCAFTGGIELVDNTFTASCSIGGIVGCMSPMNGTGMDHEFKHLAIGTLHIKNCYNSGYYTYTGKIAVDVVDPAKGYNVNTKNIHWGGIIGHAGSMVEITPTDEVPMPYLIENCYNLYAQTRRETEKSAARYVSGGIVGRSVGNAKSSSVFWLKNCYSVQVEAGGLSTAGSTNLYRCDEVGRTSQGEYAVQVVKDAAGNDTVGIRTAVQMQADVARINVQIARIQQCLQDVANLWSTGEGEPKQIGTPGDLYLDILTGNVYQYGTDVWMLIGSIKGADGENGADGKDGADGTNGKDGAEGERGNGWYSGNAYPTVGSVYRAGDLYLNTATGDVYRFNGTIWSLMGNLMGPKGEDGSNGADGKDGKDGADASISDSANAGGTEKDTAPQDQASDKSGNGLAIVAIVIAAVMGCINIALFAVILVKKKKN